MIGHDDSAPSLGHRRLGPLVEVEELAGHLDDGSTTVLDVRWTLSGGSARGRYRRGHVPGAAFVDMERELAGPVGPKARTGRHPLPEASVFGAAMRRAGVSGGMSVVCYDQAESFSAARCWWLLSYFGHRDVSVLDGGFAAWEASGHGIETGEQADRAGDFEPRPGQRVLLDAEAAARAAHDGVLLDARSYERYTGAAEPIDPVGGHIPGAVSAPTDENLGPEGLWLSPSELRSRFEALGVRPGQPAGAYCGSGVTAAHEVLALELAGFAGAGLYVGSWSEWCRDPDRPVATGPWPGAGPAA
ncbi:MAG: sulfurtransferase [Acidimicrobiales bacterium]